MSIERKIKILPENLANKIAAGEVVERPASAVKELVENALDAGSTEVTVIVKDGGKALIQVVDNGQGMSRDDVLLAFQRHTTSKIGSMEDLENIRTFGFRGEALASIASVSRVEVKTAQQESSENTFLKLEGGVVVDITDAPAVPGTSIAIKNLFFNTPARRKFLRSDAAEYRQIIEVMKRFFIAAPEVAFTFVNDDEIIYELKPTTLEARIVDVLGKRCENHLITVADDGGYAKITGFVGDWDLFRKSRGQQYLFLNKRYIVDRSLNHAIVSGYGPTLPQGNYPLYAIFLEIDPQEVDVNVHPTKIEVKFSADRLVYSLLRGASTRALNTDSVIPQTASQNPEILSKRPTDEQSELDFRSTFGSSGFSPSKIERTSSSPNDFIRREWQTRNIVPTRSPAPPVFPKSTPVPVSGPPVTPPIEVTATETRTEPKPERPFVWQLHNRYILTQIKTGLIIVDQHVAHERILFELAMENFEKKSPSSQQLLFPEVIDLSPEDASYFKEILPFVSHIGYEIKQFSGRSISIESVPSGIKHAADEKVLLQILDEYKKSKGDNFDIRESVAASFACKAAIKAGEKLTQEEMIVLIDDLFETKTPYFCPHGRPIIITISLEELDKRFGRI